MAEVVMCRHCKVNKQSRPKGLCWPCSQNPAVRAMYPSTSKFAPKETRDGGGRETAAELDALVAAQMADLPAWWNESARNAGYGKYGAGPPPKKPRQGDAPRMPKRSRRAGKK